MILSKRVVSWYAYNDAKIAQGREAAKQFMEDNPEVALEIEHKIKAAILDIEMDEEPIPAPAKVAEEA